MKIYNAFRKYIFVCRWNITGTQYSFISPEVGRFEGEKERIGVGFLVVFFLGGGWGAYADIPGIMLLSKISELLL